uniref:Putative serine/threonine-protein kinase fnkE n=1 Tax=Lygus hesperus TaxID=30085 RepID=A0A0A9Z5L6_LYGHE
MCVEDCKQTGKPLIMVCANCLQRGYVQVNKSTKSSKSATGVNAKRIYSEGSNALSVNLPCLPGCTPPSLSIKGNLHSTQNTTARAVALIHRQQYYTQNDRNLLMQPQPLPSKTDTTTASSFNQLARD